MQSISILLLSWHDDSAALAQCQRILKWQRIAPRIFWIQNSPSRASTALTEVEIIHLPTNAGYAGGMNAGLRAATGSEAILLLNNDVRVEESSVLRLIEHMSSNLDVGAIGPVLDERGRLCIGGRDPLHHIATRIYQNTEDTIPAAQLTDVDYVPGTCLLLRGSAIHKAGMLDEAFFFSGEIAEYCRTLRSAGYRTVIAQDAICQHDPEPSEARDLVYRYYTLRNRFLMSRRRPPRLWLIWGMYWTVIGTLMLLKALPRNRAVARSITLALRDGWIGRFGNRNELFSTIT